MLVTRKERKFTEAVEL
jgi:large subunit ribosomal protein L10Ae